MRATLLALLVLFAALPAIPAAADTADACDVAAIDGAFPFPADCVGSVPGGFGSQNDAITFLVPERARVVFQVTNEATGPIKSLLVDLTGPDGSFKVGPNAWNGETRRLGIVVETAGRWTLHLNGFSSDDSDVVPYRFSARLEPAPPPIAPQNDCGSDADAAHDWASLAIVVPIACEGDLTWSNDPDGYGNDDADVYRFDLREGDTLVATATVPVGARICFFVHDHEGDGCVARDEESDPSTLAFRVPVLQPTSGHIEIDRILPQAVAYDFEIDVIEPTWHEQLEARHVTLGADQKLFSEGFFAPEQTIGPVPLPEGLFAAWIPLEVPAQPRGSIDLAWTSSLPTDLRLVLADERSVWATCDAPLGATSLRCDREIEDDWDHFDEGEITWAGVIVDQGAEIDLTLTFRHWTFGSPDRQD